MDFFRKLQENNPQDVKSADIEFKRYNEGKRVSLDTALLLQYKIDKAYEVVDLEFAPGYRRTEMAAQLSDSCEILIDRAWVWRDIYAFLFPVWKKGEIKPFIDFIQPGLETTRQQCGNEERFRQVAGNLYLFSASEYAKAVDGLKMKATIKNAYKYIDTNSENYNMTNNGLSDLSTNTSIMS